jgi:hypothetical protein
VWTPTGVWQLSAEEAGWTGEFHHTDHVHGITANDDFECFDRDVTDHVGKCSDSADTPAGTDCAAMFAAADTYEKDSCSTDAPHSCTWTPAPLAPTVKLPHPAAAKIPSYSFVSGACRTTSPANQANPDATPMQDRPPYMYTKNSEFPAFPTGLSPTELAARCDEINDLHAMDATANPASCLGFHSGPWVSVFGANIHLPGPHLAAGWSPWDEGSGAVDLSGTKPNIQYVCYIADWQGGKPHFFPSSVPAPLAYYYLNEGAGWDLMNSVDRKRDAGTVVYVDEHQLHANGTEGAGHQGPNWLQDEHFGTSIACGKIDDTIIQKDTLSLADVDYGSTGSWRGACGSGTRRASISPTTSASSSLGTATRSSQRARATRCISSSKSRARCAPS